MATTPTVWLEDFIVNTTTDGIQNFEKIITLANGNLLVSWTSSNDTGAGSPDGVDVIGQVFDPFGNLVGQEFRLNTAFNVDDERDGEIAPLPNGGFIVVYEDDDGTDDSIRLQEFDANGAAVSSGTTVVNDTNGVFAGFVDPIIAAASDSSVMIAYEGRNPSSETNIFFKMYNPQTNAYSAEQVLMSNEGVFSLDEITVLSNGNYVVVGSPNTIPNSVKMRIVDSQGNNVLGLTAVADTETNSTVDFDADVTALKSGGFVVAWRNVDSADTDIHFQIHDSVGNAIGPVGFVASGSSTNENTFPKVVALEDGGFIVVYSDDEGFFEATRYERFDADGRSVGETAVLTNQTGTITDATLMEDGRVAIIWSDDGDIHMEIIDPRDNVVTADIGDDVTVGGLEASEITGSSGNDNIFGLDGSDVIKGGGGTDIIEGGAGNDIIEGGFSTDTVRGGAGSDIFIVREGEFYDNSFGGNGVDILDHSETVRSGTSFDFLNGTITGAGISGVEATVNSIERFVDGDGANIIISDGFGVYFGNGGNDIMHSNAGIEFMDGGDGIDTIDHSSFTGDYIFNLNAGLTNLSGEQFLNFENANMGSGDDLVVGTSADNTINGNAGNDQIEGRSGNDFLSGGAGNDEIEGNQGVDFIFGDAGNDLIEGGDGVDSLFGGTGDDTFMVKNGEEFDNVRGESGTDTLDHSGTNSSGTTIDFSIRSITGTGTGGISLALEGVEIYKDGNGANTIISNGSGSYFGNGGNDLMISGNGSETMNGGAGIDTINFSASGIGNTFDMKTGENSGSVGTFANFENAITGDGRDTIVGTDDANTITSGDGRDRLFGGDGDDTLSGQSGRDLLFGGNGNDILAGGFDNDTLFGGTGADVFVFEANGGRDRVFDFEDGSDKLDLSEFGFSNLSEALGQFSERGSATNDQVRFSADGTTIDIRGLDLADIDASDIII